MFYPIHVHKEKVAPMGPPFPTSPAALPQLTTGKICRARPRKPSRRTSTARPKQFPRRPLPKHGPAMRTSRGYWMMVDIDLSKVSTKAVRLNISLPENLVHRIDEAAQARRMSRSAFLAMAAEHEMTTA